MRTKSRGRGDVDDREIERDTHVSTSEQSPSEGRVRYDRRTDLARRSEDADVGVLDVEREHAVLDLHGCDGVYCVGAA